MPDTYQYTNGFDALKVLPILKERVKWSADGKTPETASKSGRYFDDMTFHALASEQTLRSVQQNANISDADFAKFRASFVIAAVQRALALVFTDIRFIDNTLLFDVSPDNRPYLLPAADLVGYQLSLANSKEHVAKIESVLLDFDQATAVVLYLFKEGSNTPLWTQTVQAVAGEVTVAALTDCYLSYAQTKSNVFYFGYKPAELQNNAKARACYGWFPNTTYVMGAKPVLAKLPAFRQEAVYTPEYYGLNIEVVSHHDYTNRLLSAPHLLDELIGLCGTAAMLEQIVFTTRSNGQERVVAGKAFVGAQFDLLGALPIDNAPQIESIRSRIKTEVKKIQQTLTPAKGGVLPLD